VKICLVGAMLSGKTALFSALTGLAPEEAAAKGPEPVAVVKVPDVRVDRLAEVFKPKKKIHAAIEFTELAGIAAGDSHKTGFSEQFLGKLRTADALLLVVRSFRDPAVPHPRETIDPVRDLRDVEAEFLLSDLAVIEKRYERLEKEIAARKSERDVRELAVLKTCRAALEEERPLRLLEFKPDEELLIRGYRFLTQKPLIVAVNLDESDICREGEALAPFAAWAAQANTAVIGLSAKIEMELCQLPEEELRAFLADYRIDRPAREKLIAETYRLMGLISFFTVGPDEVKAWTICDGTKAVSAAGEIHSDIERGFIRAEVVPFDDFIAVGAIPECRTKGTLRLEGKDYRVKDGDIINFRFAI
jgi:GTP-binding protein YchF